MIKVVHFQHFHGIHLEFLDLALKNQHPFSYYSGKKQELSMPLQPFAISSFDESQISLLQVLDLNKLESFFPNQKNPPHLIASKHLTTALYFLQDCQIILNNLTFLSRNGSVKAIPIIRF